MEKASLYNGVVVRKLTEDELSEIKQEEPKL